METIIRRISADARLVGILAILAATVGLSLKAIFIKLAYQVDSSADAITVLALRMLVALPMFMLFHWLYVKRDSPALTVKDYTTLAAMGMVGFYLSALLDYSALQYIPAGLERLVLFLYPTFVVLITWVVKPTEISRRLVMALALSYAGIVVVFVEQAPLMDSATTKGVVMVFGAALVFSFYTVASVDLIRRLGAMRFTVHAMYTATLVIVAHGLYVHGISLLAHPPILYIYIVPMAAFATALPLVLTAAGIKRIGAARASVIGTLGPPMTLFIAWLVLGEHFGPLQLTGGALIVLGVFMLGKR